MGTRGVTGFKLDGRYVVYYNHFDSYPEGLGEEVVQFCKEMVSGIYGSPDTIKDRISRIELVEEDSTPTEDQIEQYKDFADLNVSTQSYKDWYCLLRDCQMSNGLRNIVEGKQFHVIDSVDFIQDSLFCEYGYIINLDTGMLEFYKGFQNAPQEGNPFGTEPYKREYQRPDEWYYPCRLVGSCPLDSISDNWIDLYNEREAI